jgi:EAL domain-containing protein (putative c-di-GMP-specific phosphodiesterase class I)
VTDEVAATTASQRQGERQRGRVIAVMADDNVRAVFQPIVNLSTGEICGYEALSRFDSSSIGTPQQWFDAAETVGLRSELEIHAICKAIAHVHQLPPSVFLSFNASPETVIRDDFRDLVEELHGESIGHRAHRTCGGGRLRPVGARD